MPKPTIIIAYYPLRGRAQVPRLLCQYLGVNYQDKMYTYQEWIIQKTQKSKKGEIREIPYLQQGKFSVFGAIPMCIYLIDRFGNEQMLGRDFKDQGIVDMYLWTIDTMSDIININCQQKSEEEMREFKQHQWNNMVSPKLQKYEEFSKSEGWFMGYLTIIDFSLYELVRYMKMIFGAKMQKFVNLNRITDMLGNLPQIKAYEQSDRSIKDMCPTVLLKKIKDNTLTVRNQ